MSEQIIYLTNRTASITDDDCGRKWWLSQRVGGRGLVPKEEAFALMVGRETHEDLSAIGEMDDISPEAIQRAIDDILLLIDDAAKTHIKKMEMLYRRLGWLAAFALYMEPSIRAIYDTVSIEKELVLDRTPLWVAVTPDRILRHREKGYLVYREYKSTISASQKWLDSWKMAIQIHSSMKAVEEEVGLPVAFTQVMGLMKGYEKEGKIRHPYVYGYRNRDNGDWTHDYDRARGPSWELTPVWDYPGGVVQWVQLCGEDIAFSQFPHTEPIFLNEEILNEWVERRARREEEIRRVEESAHTDARTRAVYFPRKTHKCRPPFGDSCPYLGLCWNATWEGREVEHPDFSQRIPHHDLELIV